MEGRSLSSRLTQQAGKDRGLGNLQTPESVQKLQTALHAKAKEEPGYRFYLLYDKVYRRDVLEFAYRNCKANKGAAGVDGVRFEDIEAYGEERWLGELAERLKTKDYRPEAVKRVWIPKPNGKLRPLGIPTITDRVVQTAAMIVLEPIFEADLQPEQYAYRAERGAQDAVRAVHRLLNTGHQQVIEADLSGYFDSIPHAELMKSVARRIVDRHVLHLIKQWLEMPVEEDDGDGHLKRTTTNRDAGRGTPQGAPISPLLSNLYMRRFILGWKQRGHGDRWSADFVSARMLRRNQTQVPHQLARVVEAANIANFRHQADRAHHINPTQSTEGFDHRLKVPAFNRFRKRIRETLHSFVTGLNSQTVFREGCLATPLRKRQCPQPPVKSLRPGRLPGIANTVPQQEASQLMPDLPAGIDGVFPCTREIPDRLVNRIWNPDGRQFSRSGQFRQPKAVALIGLDAVAPSFGNQRRCNYFACIAVCNQFPLQAIAGGAGLVHHMHFENFAHGPQFA